MPDVNESLAPIFSELRILQGRVLELERRIISMKSPACAAPAAAMNPAMWVPERFVARITADHADGTYDVRRMVATGRNAFADDDSDTDPVTIANPAERTSYVGMFAIGDIVCVQFDGLDDQDQAIYHLW